MTRHGLAAPYRSADACGADVTCADRVREIATSSKAELPALANASWLPKSGPSASKVAPASAVPTGTRTGQTEIPIGRRLWPGGSGLQDVRTPAGIRNSSGKRLVRFSRWLAISSCSFWWRWRG